jgi:hypothetical protein
MARRRSKDADFIGPLAQAVGFLVLLCLISPQVRLMIHTIGFIAIGFLGFAAVGFGAYRLAIRSDPPQGIEPNVNLEAFRIDVRREPEQPSPPADLVGQLRSIDWFQFEKLVGVVYHKLGYAVTRRGGANPDGGIDLVIEKEGRQSAVQCKQWRTWTVGVRTVREFLGALTDARIQTGILITLSGYSGEAKKLAEKHGIEIVNETGLTLMLEATHASVDPVVIEILRDTRKLCPKCERALVLRTARKGAGIGKQFWGCSTYPRCKFTMPLSPCTSKPATGGRFKAGQSELGDS